jgi:nitrogen fixation NifU-like protein
LFFDAGIFDVSDELYDDHILDHFESPYHKGHLPCPTCTHSDRNPICGDQVTIELDIDNDNRVREAFFDGKGCAISQAAASILCESIEGKTLDELREFQAKDMLDLIKVRLTASRQKCGLLGFKVLKTMLYTLDQKPADQKSVEQ